LSDVSVSKKKSFLKIISRFKTWPQENRKNRFRRKPPTALKPEPAVQGPPQLQPLRRLPLPEVKRLQIQSLPSGASVIMSFFFATDCVAE